MTGTASDAGGEAAIVQPHDDLLDEIANIIDSLEGHPDPEVHEKVTALLGGIDAVHRTALTHLFSAIVGMGGDQFMDRLTADPAIRLLFMSYDLLAVDRRINAEEALDAVRGHLHSHGVDVELLDVGEARCSSSCTASRTACCRSTRSGAISSRHCGRG